MCLGAPSIPEPKQYAPIKTPYEGSGEMSEEQRRRRQAAAAAASMPTGPRGLMAQPALALKTLTGQ